MGTWGLDYPTRKKKATYENPAIKTWHLNSASNPYKNNGDNTLWQKNLIAFGKGYKTGNYF